MKMICLGGLCLVLFSAMSHSIFANASYDQRTAIGPERGWLIIHGGGEITPEVRDRFVALAGGPNASVVAIPTARADKEFDLGRYGAQIARLLGVSRVTVLHTRDRDVANSMSFVEPLKHATGVWLDGGRQWRLADAYLNTAVLTEIKALLQRGGVVMGSSAGATIQGSFLVRGDSGIPGNPDGDNTIMVSPGHVTGFGLLRASAIDQHVDARNREDDLDPVISAHPELLGIGLFQGAAIIVHGDAFFVVSAPALIHDGRMHGGKQYHTLPPGQMYDLKHRALLATPSAAEMQQYPMDLILDRASRTTLRNEATTLGTGQLKARNNTSPSRRLNVVCKGALYSAGAMPYPAHFDGTDGLSVLVRALDGNTLSGSTCQIVPLPNMNCGDLYSPNWNDCVGAVQYPNGNTYSGEFHHGMRDGLGVLVISAIGISDRTNIRSSEPTLYIGEFRDNRLNGRGVWITKSGQASSGSFVDNFPQPDVSQKNCGGPLFPSWTHCVGTLTYGNGNVYRGEFMDGHREGIGMLDIRAIGMPDETSIRMPAQGVYVGEFSGDRLNGPGMILMPKAGFYGTFVNNVLEAPPANH